MRLRGKSHKITHTFESSLISLPKRWVPLKQNPSRSPHIFLVGTFSFKTICNFSLLRKLRPNVALPTYDRSFGFMIPSIKSGPRSSKYEAFGRGCHTQGMYIIYYIILYYIILYHIKSYYIILNHIILYYIISYYIILYYIILYIYYFNTLIHRFCVYVHTVSISGYIF